MSSPQRVIYLSNNTKKTAIEPEQREQQHYNLTRVKVTPEDQDPSSEV